MMYAIKVEDRYLVELGYGRIKTSTKPVAFKDLRTAKTVLEQMIKTAQSYEQAWTKYAQDAEAKAAKIQRRLAKIDEVRAELFERPYKEVFARISKLDREYTDKKRECQSVQASIAPWRRDATRMRTLVAKKPQIVVLGDRPLSSVDILDILKV
jgi:chromosome segregation ATPase